MTRFSFSCSMNRAAPTGPALAVAKYTEYDPPQYVAVVADELVELGAPVNDEAAIQVARALT